ncbi:lipopolysaccharide biosynthesis protein [Modestobacter sp. VKM Ac-2984]|uniref:lipopolysaccharide biosynthesis protein n=1 Tax=Modestobacter sp. VKM Ac-2984 TaxID=3004138 RepID=UPI0022A9FD72|nr:lipopolysaccharide biosynthesis protein [Modestobacter sp. VKM Ac-2984]MCZ2817363.1 lipopolysaccharide biosynthesis protein [Modestobacter sp. VKM Ac-2984]
MQNNDIGITEARPMPAPGDVVPATVEQAQSIGGAVRKGVLWTSLSRVVVQLLQVGVTVALARLLAPADFGAVTIVTSITGFAALFVELGLVSALVQRNSVDETVLSTAFWLNAVLGVVLAVPVVALAPVAAALFDTPSLVYLMPVASLTFVLSLSVVQSATLRRALDFKRLARIGIVNAVANAVVAVACAAAGLGALSIVLGTVAATLVSTIQSWCYVPWRPKVRPTRQALRELWSYTRGLVGFGSVNYWSRNADNLLIGGFLGTTALGYYGRAYNLMLMPVSQLNAVLNSVLFSTLSRLQADEQRFRRAWLLSAKASFMAGAPIGIGMSVTAPALVETFFGARWLPMAPVLALLAASVPPQLIGSATGSVFQAKAKNDLQFRLGLITSCITVAAILGALPFGIVAVAAALLVKSWTSVLIPLIPTLRLAGISFLNFLRAISWTGMSTVAMGAAAWAAGHALRASSPPLVLGVQVATGVIVYGALIIARERPFIRELRGARKRKP